jgi:hypothetical protein
MVNHHVPHSIIAKLYIPRVSQLGALFANSVSHLVGPLAAEDAGLVCKRNIHAGTDIEIIEIC